MPAASGTNTPQFLEQVIQQQLQLMGQQISLLSGYSSGTSDTLTALQSSLAGQVPQTGGPAPAEPSRAVASTPVAEQPQAPKVTARFGPYKPVERAKDGGLTSKQEKHLEQFTQRFIKKTKNPHGKRCLNFIPG